MAVKRLTGLIPGLRYTVNGSRGALGQEQLARGTCCPADLNQDVESAQAPMLRNFS